MKSEPLLTLWNNYGSLNSLFGGLFCSFNTQKAETCRKVWQNKDGLSVVGRFLSSVRFSFLHLLLNYKLQSCCSEFILLFGSAVSPLLRCFFLVLRRMPLIPGTGFMSLLLMGGGCSIGFGARVRQTGRPAAHIRIPVIPDAWVEHTHRKINKHYSSQQKLSFIADC